MTVRILPIVEGDGEELAVRDLITRIASEFWNENEWVEVLKPIKRPRNKLVHSDDLERVLETAAIILREKGGGAIFVLIDSDGDCPATLGPQMLKRANQVCQQLKTPVSVVLAHQEYEAWFLASATSLGGFGSMHENLEPHPNPEGKSGAKEWLNARMTRKYKETHHQAAFTTRFDLRIARANADSFDKCCRDIERLCKELEQ